MEDLLASQNQLMGAIEQLFVNFKKDGAERKTPPQVKKRLSTLESYWQEFQCTHIKLCEFDDKSHEYFTNNCYNKTSEFYNDARNYIYKYLPSDPLEKLLIRPATPLSSPGFLTQPPCYEPPPQVAQTAGYSGGQPGSSRSQGTSSKLEDMLRRQKSNFKAFVRTINGVNLEVLVEKWEFEDILKTIQSRWSVIDMLHWEIDSETYEENLEYEEAFSRYEKMYNKIKKQINSKMWSECHRERSTPHVDVPIFSGNYHSWVSFKDLFMETIHNNRSLSSAQKMQYLKSKIRNEPEKLIQHLHITSDNYQVAWDILNQRYNNTKLIFNSHMSILLNIPNMQVQSAVSIKRIHDTTNECLNAVKNLGVDITTWDPLIVYLISQKLDSDTHNDYIETMKNPRDLPSLQELLEFLEAKFTALESSKRKSDTIKFNPQLHSQQNRQPPSFDFKKNNFFKPSSSRYQFTKSYNSTCKIYRQPPQRCPVCNKEHAIFDCETFFRYQPDVKRETIHKLSLCKNCLYDHRGKACFSLKRCRLCKGEHNTILHDAFVAKSEVAIPSTSSKDKTLPKNSMSVLHRDTQEVLLATALIKVRAQDGTDHIMRALIDQGSQTSIITENAAQLLGLQRKRCKGIILGVGATENNCKGVVNITIKSCHDQFSTNADVFIMKRAVNNLPNQSFNKPSWPYIQNILLADPEFYRSRSVDLLLGADVYASIIMDGVINSGQSATPIAQQTRLGWILCGNVKSYQCNVVLLNVEDIQQFWSIKDINESSDMSEEDYQCLQLHNTTTSRQADGRYIVRLPLHPEIDTKLGVSKSKAIAQFYQTEKKLQKQDQFAIDYKSFMSEYIDLGHMNLALGKPTLGYYMPHHGVRRAESTTSALRVVFNASQPTSNGLSLNDLMFRGPNLQQDLMLLLIKWRQFKYAITADVEKMFRQIIVAQEDQKYQKIIWREDQNQPLQEYQLTTVTYGTKAAPFLAMQTLKQLAKDEGHRFPEAAKAIQGHFYMDDLLYGHFDIQSTKQLQCDLTALLKLGGFNLRKWSSNEPAVLAHIKNNQNNNPNFDFKHQDSAKTLGITWNSKEDCFTFQCKISKITSTNYTKRKLLGEISKTFDPLGWLSPAVVQLKLLFQNVWLMDLKWDDQIPEHIQSEWFRLSLDIVKINEIKIPRWLHCYQNDCIQLHGFCDASTKAYACVIYARVQNTNQPKAAASVTLLAAKTKVVPINKKYNKVTSNAEVSLPRLELCGAHLLSKLMAKVCEGLNQHKLQIFGWCDSTAVLGWLHGEPNRWKPFVANRVKKITQNMTSNCWNHIKSQENPADCASRGMTVEKLQNHELWWNGPSWLKSYDERNFIKNNSIPTNNLEIRKIQSNVIQQTDTSNDIISILISKYSNFTRLVRVVAWLLRAVTRDRLKQAFLSANEIESAELKIIKYVQHIEYAEEIHSLKNLGKVSSKSKLTCLNPFLDSNGLVRVGGRLKSANIEFEMKHPRIMPHNHTVTLLLIDNAHTQTYHGGARLTHSWLRQKYWILSGNRTVKGRLRQCVLCRRHSPTKHSQIMGDLPQSRTTPSRPFYHCGVDYSGYVDVKASKGPGIKTSKGYVAVFVCMVTKAVHLELVSDLTSSAFLAALRRMAAKRGTPRHMYSDNGTNFTKASKTLTSEYVDLQTLFTDQFQSEVSEMQITWHFNAPSWPSAGGLWEAAVKSLKHHLRRVVGEQKLTYEEFHTLLSQLEACLNSRPLCALTEDPDDINYLTPSHFLASGPNLTLIETERDERTRWQLTQKIFGDIWRRWRTEYLVQLSARSKWHHTAPNVNINDIVIIHDVNLPAGKWPLGRVVETHPGTDGHVRVVSVKTKNGILKRPIVKLSLLPVHNEQVNQKQTITQPTAPIAPVINKPITRKTSKRQGLSTHINFISIIMTLMFLIISSVNCTYNITKIETNKGIYFDEISNMKLVQDEWKIITYYNMDPYWQGTQLLSLHVKHLEEICAEITEKSHCNIILLQLQHGLSEIEFYNRLLLDQQFTGRGRVRRGLVDGVGYIANSLFGVLDARFAEQYERDIETLRKNQGHLVHLLKNQTSIIESENNLLKRMEDSIAKQHKIYNQHLNNLERIANSMKKDVQQIQVNDDFILSTITANNILQGLKNIQNMLLNTITDAKHLNVHLLTPTQLHNELNVISAQLPKELSLPIDNALLELPKIYKMFKVKARMSQSYFIFEIKLPLINRENYAIYKLIPIRHQVGSVMVNIQPISQYLAINIRKDTFISIDTTEFYQRCYEFDTSIYFCKLQKPVYQRQTDQNYCIRDLHEDKCTVITGQCITQWTELLTLNTFLISCCNQCALRFICEDQVTDEQLAGVNIITMESECIIKGDYFTINSHKDRTNILNIEPKIYAPNIAPINQIVNLSVPINNLEENRSNFNLSLQDATNQIQGMKGAEDNLEDQIESMSSHDIHHYAAIYVVVAAAVVCALAMLLRARRRRQARAAGEAPGAAAPAAGSAEREVTSVCESVVPSEKQVRVENKRECRVEQSVSGIVKRPSPVVGKFERVNIATSPILTKCSFDISEN